MTWHSECSPEKWRKPGSQTAAPGCRQCSQWLAMDCLRHFPLFSLYMDERWPRKAFTMQYFSPDVLLLRVFGTYLQGQYCNQWDLSGAFCHCVEFYIITNWGKLTTNLPFHFSRCTLLFHPAGGANGEGGGHCKHLQCILTRLICIAILKSAKNC